MNVIVGLYEKFEKVEKKDWKMSPALKKKHDAAKKEAKEREPHEKHIKGSLEAEQPDYTALPLWSKVDGTGLIRSTSL